MSGTSRVTALAIVVALGCDATVFDAVVPMNTVDASGGPAVDLRRDLIGHWTFDDASGSNRARDASGNGLDGVLHGFEAGAVWGPGHVGGALTFSGAAWIEVPASGPLMELSAPLTVAAWVFVPSTGARAGRAVVAARQAGTSDGDQVYLRADRTAALWSMPSGSWAEAPGALPLDRWVHVAGTCDGTTNILYVSGAELARAPVRSPPGREVTPFTIGANVDRAGPSQHFVGSIDDVRLYGRALNALEVQALATF